MKPACWPVPPTLTSMPIPCGDRGNPRDQRLHRGERSLATSVQREDRTRPSTHPGSGVPARRRKSGWMSPIEIDEQHDAVGPCWKTPVDAQVPKGFSRQFVKPYLECCDGRAAKLQARQRWARSPSTWHRFLSRSGSILLARVTWCVSSGGVLSEPQARRESRLRRRSAMRTGLVVRPRESPRPVFGLKDSLSLPIPKIRECRGPPLRCDRLFPRAAAGSDGSEQGIECRKSQGIPPQSAADLITSSGRIVGGPFLLHEHELGSFTDFSTTIGVMIGANRFDIESQLNRVQSQNQS